MYIYIYIYGYFCVSNSMAADVWDFFFFFFYLAHRCWSMRLHMGKERICVGVDGAGGGDGVLALSAMTVISGQMAHGGCANTVRESARRVNSLSVSKKKKKKKKKKRPLQGIEPESALCMDFQWLVLYRGAWWSRLSSIRHVQRARTT